MCINCDTGHIGHAISCGGWLACDTDDTVCLDNFGDAIARKPAPTDKHPDQDQDFGYPNPSINPLRRLTLRCTASSKTPARGSIRLNQCLARVIPV